MNNSPKMGLQATASAPPRNLLQMQILGFHFQTAKPETGNEAHWSALSSLICDSKTRWSLRTMVETTHISVLWFCIQKQAWRNWFDLTEYQKGVAWLVFKSNQLSTKLCLIPCITAILVRHDFLTFLFTWNKFAESDGLSSQPTTSPDGPASQPRWPPLLK